MILRNLAAVAVFIGAGLAQEVSVSGNLGANNQTTPTAQDGNITIHYVTVGKAQNNFEPNSINAKPGDIVSFQFYPSAHSVIKAQYGYPCVPYEDINIGAPTFYSGVMPVKQILPDPPTWNLTVNDTAPVFYYCGAPGSCIDWGMVGVINANGSTPLSTQISLARQADYQLIPGEPFPSEEQQASLDSLAHTATTAVLTVTATAAPPETPTSSGYNNPDDATNHGAAGLSGGAIAGVAVGAAVVGIAICGVFLLLRRSRNLKKKLDASREQNQQMQHQQGPFSPMVGSFTDHSRHTSGLPAYNQSMPKYSSVPQETKPPDAWGSDRSNTPMSTPYQNQGGFVPYGQDQRWTTMTSMTSTSELGGAQQPPSELAAPHDLDPNQRQYR